MKEKKPHSLGWRILAACAALLLVVLVVLRLYLSTWLLDYVNQVLANIPGYRGSVESINIDLYRSAYRLNKLVINKVEGKIPTPFVAIDETDFSLQWAALLHGRIVAKAILTHPVVNFAIKESAAQTGQNVDWTKPIKDLTPIDIDYVRIKDGSVTYQDFSSTPKVNLYVHHMNGEVRNLRNVTDAEHPLPSSIEINGSSIGNGNLKITGRMNILKRIPDMNLLLAIEKVDLPALNSYTDAYAAFDFKSGNFNLYSQLIVKDGHIGGYVKPLVTHLSVNVLNKENPVEVAWSLAVAAVLKIFTNQSRDQFATKVDLEGNVDNVNASVWSALAGVFSNAFIQAIARGFDQTGQSELAQPQK